MRLPTRLFLALLAGAALIAAAMFVVYQRGAAERARPNAVTVRVMAALPAEPWLTQAARAYNSQKHTVEGARVTVEVTPVDGVTALNKWSKGEFKPVPTVWVAETRDWVNFANTQVADRTGRDIFLSGGEYRAQPVALSPEVWAIFQSRYKALKSKYPDGEISWNEIHEAAVSKSWAEIGGQPEWGRFKIVIPHPKRDPAGLAAMVDAAGEFYGRPSVSTDDLTNPAYQKWLQEILDSAVDFSPFGVDNILLFGYSNGDAAQIIESYLLVNMEGLQNRWKEPLVILYPDPVTWFDFPYAIYMGDETSALEKNAALDFKQYLLGVDQQKATLRFGLRPANPDVAPTGEGSLIARWQAMGFKEVVPASARMRQAPRSGLNELTAWFEKRYER